MLHILVVFGFLKIVFSSFKIFFVVVLLNMGVGGVGPTTKLFCDFLTGKVKAKI